MKKINKKDTESLLGLFILLCIGVIVIYVLPYLLVGALVLFLILKICGDDDDGEDSNNHEK